MLLGSPAQEDGTQHDWRCCSAASCRDASVSEHAPAVGPRSGSVRGDSAPQMWRLLKHLLHRRRGRRRGIGSACRYATEVCMNHTETALVKECSPAAQSTYGGVSDTISPGRRHVTRSTGRSTRATITHLAAAIAGSVIPFRTSRVGACPARTAAAASTCRGERTTVLIRPVGRASKSPEQLASLRGATARRTQRRGRRALRMGLSFGWG